MTTSELISYIRKQVENNIPKDLIISKLIGAGWHRGDIDEGFSSVEQEFKPKVSFPDTKIETKEPVEEMNNIGSTVSKENIVDKYHEPLEGDNIFEVEKIQHKAETPVIEDPKVETPKVWNPIRVPMKEIASSADLRGDGKESTEPYIEAETTQVEIQDLELEAGKENELSKPKGTENFNKPSPIIKTQSKDKGGELLPTLVPKSVVNSFGSIEINKNNLTKSVNNITPSEPSKNSLNNNLSKMAMLSSYPKDLLSVNKVKEESVKQNNHKIIKWLILVLAIIAIAFCVWAFVSGHISLNKINFSFIKKDPKILLLNNSKVLSSLESYKTETNIEVSSPSFANITYGLVSGEAVPSQDKDSFSINTLGIINRNEKGLLSDNFVIIKSSLLQDYITLDIKNNGSDLFISVPDLSEILKENVPKSTVVKINKQQFSLIPPLFSKEMETQLNKINIYKILSSGMPSYINNETLSAYNELINNVEITEKGQENIRGINTYHYGIIADRQLAKNLLSKISDNFVLNLSDDDKDRLTQILSGVTIDSFDVWIGKGDSNIYQYNIVLGIPLSKIIGFEDKSIGNNIVNINWKTTYYDFDISNNIFMPDTSTPVTDFVNNIKETKMKNDVSSFKQLATNLLKAEKTYGKISNTKGSCTNPSSGSLFSPTGHTKGAATAISSISLLLNKILGTTNGAGFCYSTPKAWSFTIPISDNYNPTDVSIPPEYKYFFCVDNTGSALDLIAPPDGVICK